MTYDRVCGSAYANPAGRPWPVGCPGADTQPMTDAASAETTPLRVLVVDPDDRIRESLARLLPIGGRCLVVGGAGDADAAIELIEGMKPDVVMIDSRVAQGDAGADLVERFRVARRG